MALNIDRCVCANRTFADLIEQAERERLSLPELVRETGASAGCGMCRPYLCRAYRSGQCTFHELLDPDDEPNSHRDDDRFTRTVESDNSITASG